MDFHELSLHFHSMKNILFASGGLKRQPFYSLKTSCFPRVNTASSLMCGVCSAGRTNHEGRSYDQGSIRVDRQLHPGHICGDISCERGHQAHSSGKPLN